MKNTIAHCAIVTLLSLAGWSVNAQVLVKIQVSPSSPTSIVTTVIGATNVEIWQSRNDLAQYRVTNGGQTVNVMPGGHYTFSQAGGYPLGVTIGTVQTLGGHSVEFTVSQIGGSGANTATPTTVQPTICTSGNVVTAINPDGSVTCGPGSGGSGTGNTTSTSLTTGKVPKSNGTNSIIDSSLSDNGTTVSTTEPLTAASISTGTAPTAVGAGATGGMAVTESANTGWTPTAGQDYFRGDNALHAFVASLNGAAELPIPEIAGDLCGTAASPTVCGVNGATVPASATILGSNSSKQLVLTTALPCSTLPALTGDITTSAGSCGTTLPTVNSNVGAFTSANITVNAKGQVTAAANGTGSTGNAAVASTSAVTSSNPTINTDQQLIELSLSAGYLNTAHQPFLIHGGGTYSSTTASSPALTFKIKLCTVSGCGSGTVVTLVNIVTTALNTTALTNATWSLGATAVTNTTGATGNLVVKGIPGLVLDLGATVTTADSVFADTNTATSSNIDLTAALFVDFTVAQSVVGASNSYTQMMGMVGPVAGTGPAGPAGNGVVLVPATTTANTIAPTANSVVGLTVLGTTGTGSPDMLDVCTNSVGACGTKELYVDSGGAVWTGTAMHIGGAISINGNATIDNSGSNLGVLFFGATGDHIIQAAASTDITGTIAISSATSASHTFTTAYGAAPNCLLTPKSDPTATGVWWVTTSTTVVTANIKISGTISFTYVCSAAGTS